MPLAISTGRGRPVEMATGPTPGKMPDAVETPHQRNQDRAKTTLQSANHNRMNRAVSRQGWIWLPSSS